MELAELASELLARVAAQHPKVHCLTNSVAEPITANILLSVGALPSLTSEPDEIPDFLRGADALMINLGTPGTESLIARRMAATAAVRMNIPWVLDPVMAERSDARRAEAVRLIAEHPTAIRCNSGEASTLAPELNGYDGVLIGTGPSDRIRYRDQRAVLVSGHPMLSRVTATGCALSALVAAFIGVHREDPFLASLAALACFGAAGSEAAERSKGPGSFAVALIDALPALSTGTIALHIEKLDIYEVEETDAPGP